MAKKRNSVEQIIGKLREAEVALAEGHPLLQRVQQHVGQEREEDVSLNAFL